MGSSLNTWWWQAGGKQRKRHGLIIFRSPRSAYERRVGIDFDPLRQSIAEAIAVIERQVATSGEIDDSLEIQVQVGDSPLLLSRESNQWLRLARLGTALLREAENFDVARFGRPGINRIASAS